MNRLSLFAALVSSMSVLSTAQSGVVSPVIIGSLSFSITNNSGLRQAATYGGDVFLRQAWTLELAAGEPNALFTICATKDDGDVSCTPNFGRTDQYGNWLLTGTFDATTLGGWTEWLQFPSGAISNRISFTVRNLSIGYQLKINNDFAGIFHVSQPWTLSLSGAPQNTSFGICGETGGNTLGCTANFGLTDTTGSWSMSSSFPDSTVGGWTLWLRFPSGDTNRVSFTIIGGPLDDLTCASGTLRPIGPDAGYGGFRRYEPDWKPQNSGDYAVIPGRTGGVGNTLEYVGCSGGNYVWLAWEFGGLSEIAVRAPWTGQTDQGLRIGDDSARFQALYPTAHRPIPGDWPQDFDVWDVGPLRVVLRNGRVYIIQVSWGFANDIPGPDVQGSFSTIIGPWCCSAYRWY